MYERVYTCTDWYDGPRGGIADYQGKPHLFASEYRDFEQQEDTFLLSPVADETFQLALEAWTIWQRWEAAFYQKQTGLDTHPVLPEDRTRHKELQYLLEGRLSLPSTGIFRKEAQFRERTDEVWSGFGFRLLEVKWREHSA